LERILGGGSEAAKAVSFTPSNWNARWLAHPGQLPLALAFMAAANFRASPSSSKAK
jgi:hypothetical protein